jgi:hypothetical protein
MQDIKKRLLTDFAAKERDGYFEIEFPIVINTSGTLVALRIEQLEDKYIITHPEDIFSDRGNDDLEFYFSLFMKHYKGYTYGVELVDGTLTKVCKNDYNVAVALSDFIRFIIIFDDFFTENNVIGREEEFI